MKNIRITFYTIIMFLCYSPIFAQIGDNSTDGNLETGDAPAATIDEFVWILMFAGIALVLTKASKAVRY